MFTRLAAQSLPFLKTVLPTQDTPPKQISKQELPKDSADAARVLDDPMGSAEKTTDVETALLVKLQNLKKS